MRRAFSLLLLPLYVGSSSGCYSWRASTVPIPSSDHGPAAGHYRISLSDGRVVRLRKLQVRNDSLFGLVDSTTLVGGSVMSAWPATSFPVSSVVKVERMASNDGGPAMLALALAAAIVIWIGKSVPDFSCAFGC